MTQSEIDKSDNELKKANANWYIKFTVECPYCEKPNNLMSVDEWYYVFGHIGESKYNVNERHKCEQCGKEFIVEHIEY